MTAKRIIPCLDVKDGRVVKGVQFVGLRDAGDPAELAKYYDEQGADELVLLDISASTEGRETMVDVVKKTAAVINIPLAVGGGIRTIDDMKRILEAGASKVSMNTSALANPEIIKEGAKNFSSEKIVVAIDASYSEEDGTWMVYTHGGNKKSEWKAVDWAKKAEELGAGEILLTSINKDGDKSGYDLELTKAIKDAVSIPVIASGGAGTKEHIREVLQDVNADAALAASIFHYKETSIAEVKAYLREKGVTVQ
ncbi:MAG: imidazole glycerol phosphate synthase subunit HisF [Lysinibacillus sp.]|nr:imidazole glycerol phosphate synthase subunit HisF [Lysinibacillus sp.]